MVVPKPTSEDHLQIARDFEQTLSEPTRTTLAAILGETVWFVNFSAAARNCGVGSNWASFRTSRLKELFDSSVAALGIPKIAEKPLLATSSRSQANPHTNAPFSLPNRSPLSREEALRRLVQLVVAEMPISDLRELALPIGKVIDHNDEFLK